MSESMHGVDGIRQAFNTVADEATPYEVVTECIAEVRAGLDRLEWLEAQWAQAVPLLHALADTPMERTYDEYFCCPFRCTDDLKDQPSMVTHTTSCPITQVHVLRKQFAR